MIVMRRSKKYRTECSRFRLVLIN